MSNKEEINNQRETLNKLEKDSKHLSIGTINLITEYCMNSSFNSCFLFHNNLNMPENCFVKMNKGCEMIIENNFESSENYIERSKDYEVIYNIPKQ